MIDTPYNARMSTYWLSEQYRTAKTDTKKIRLVWAAVLASNRAKVVSENPNVSAEQRQEASEVEVVYRAWAKYPT